MVSQQTLARRERMTHPALQSGHAVSSVPARSNAFITPQSVCPQMMMSGTRSTMHRVLHAGRHSSDMVAVLGNNVSGRALRENLSRSRLQQQVRNECASRRR